MKNFFKNILLVLSVIPHLYTSSPVATSTADVAYYSLQAIGLLGGSFVLENSMKYNEDIFAMIKMGIYVQPSQETKDFFAAMLKERNLENVSVKLVAGFLLGNCEDYAAVSFGYDKYGNDKYGIAMPRNKMTQLNKLLTKKTLTQEEQEELYEIEFFLGHEMHHVKRSVKKYKSSVLHTVQHQLVIRTLLGAATWAAMRNVRSASWWKAFAATVCTNIVADKLVAVFRSSEESECDLHASLNPEVLKAGAKALQEHLKEQTEAQSKKCCFGLVWACSEEMAYVLGTQHPSPKKRSKALLKKAQELEAMHKKDIFVIAGA